MLYTSYLPQILLILPRHFHRVLQLQLLIHILRLTIAYPHNLANSFWNCFNTNLQQHYTTMTLLDHKFIFSDPYTLKFIISHSLKFKTLLYGRYLMAKRLVHWRLDMGWDGGTAERNSSIFRTPRTVLIRGSESSMQRGRKWQFGSLHKANVKPKCYQLNWY